MYKTKTQTKTNAENKLTLTSPNTKYIFLKQYLVACHGAGAADTDITIQITDEDGNVLWEDAIANGEATLSTGPYRVGWTFPGKGLLAPAKKNLIVTVSAGAADEITELSLLYDI